MKPETGKWIDDLIAEPELSKRKIKWEVEAVPIDQIDLNYDNMGRIADRIDPDKVNEYGAKMLDGVPFPRPILNCWPGKGGKKYRVVGGNHRTGGAKEAGFTHLEAYVIETTDEYILETLPMALNIIHGKNVSNDERLAQAKRAIDAHGVKATQAANDLGIVVNTLNEYMRGCKTIERLNKMGIDGNKLQKKVLARMDTVTNDNTFTALGTTLVKFKVETERAVALVDEAKNKPTEMASLEVVDKFAKTMRALKRPETQTITLQTRAKFFRLLSGLSNCLKAHPSLRKLQITDAEDQEVARDKFAELFADATEIFGHGKAKRKASA